MAATQNSTPVLWQQLKFQTLFYGICLAFSTLFYGRSKDFGPCFMAKSAKKDPVWSTHRDHDHMGVLSPGWQGPPAQNPSNPTPRDPLKLITEPVTVYVS